jgi:hypothetical protein
MYVVPHMEQLWNRSARYIYGVISSSALIYWCCSGFVVCSGSFVVSFKRKKVEGV